MMNFSFDPNQYAPAVEGGSGSPPPGHYLVQIIKAEIKGATNNPSNQMLATEMQIVDGEFNGSIIKENFLIGWTDGKNPQKTVEIAFAQLSACCRAMGLVQQFSDPAVMCGRNFVVSYKFQLKNGVRVQNEGYDQKEVKGYYPHDGSKVLGPLPESEWNGKPAPEVPATAAAPQQPMAPPTQPLAQQYQQMQAQPMQQQAAAQPVQQPIQQQPQQVQQQQQPNNLPMPGAAPQQQQQQPPAPNNTYFQQ